MSSTNSKSFSTPYYTYVATAPSAPTADISYAYTYDARGTTASLVEGLSRYAHLLTNTSIAYERDFGKHKVNALALMETRQQDGNNFGAYGYGFDIFELDELNFATLADRTRVSGGSSQSRTAGFLGRLGYEYANKYFALLSFRYDGSHVFGGMVPGKRWSPFPAASLGWAVSEENWFPRSSSYISYLKLRGSVGLTGRSEIGPYNFLNTLSFLNDPAVVLNGEGQNGLLTSNPANINLTWAKSLQYNFGVDATVLKDWLDVTFDVFYRYEYDLLTGVTATYPDSYGGFVPAYMNNNERDHKGFEIALSHGRQVGDFSYRVGVNGTYTKSRWLRYADSETTPDWLKLTGKEVGAQIGFIAAGLFQSQDEIENSPLIEGKAVRVGDIKFVDRNGDGVIAYEQ